MNYTIASMKDVHGTIKVEFGKSGNQYLVGIYETENKRIYLQEIWHTRRSIHSV